MRFVVPTTNFLAMSYQFFGHVFTKILAMSLLKFWSLISKILVIDQ